MKRSLAPALLTALVAGCGFSTGGDASTARHLAGEYLSALAGEAPDRGWSLILPDSRRAYASRDQYIELAESADWSRFSWRFNDEGDYCGVYCVIRLVIDQREGIPQFLLDAPQSRDDDLLRTLSLDNDPVSPGNAELIVYVTLGGSRGISLGGG